MAGMLAVFAEFEREILRERVRAGLAHARQNGKKLGRPPSASLNGKGVLQLFRAGISKARNRSPTEYRPHFRPSHSQIQEVIGPSAVKRPCRKDTGNLSYKIIYADFPAFRKIRHLIMTLADGENP
jgi:DNA invertase Pin-like site-specific DNA recombinase